MSKRATPPSSCLLYLLLKLLALLHLTGVAINEVALGHIGLGDHGIFDHVQDSVLKATRHIINIKEKKTSFLFIILTTVPAYSIYRPSINNRRLIKSHISA